jgi:hypothetical protein
LLDLVNAEDDEDENYELKNTGLPRKESKESF